MEQVNERAIVESYVALFSEIKSRVGDSEVAAAIMHEVGKDRRMRMIQQEKGSSSGMSGSSSSGDFENPATEKQKNYLRTLGVEFNESISKAEASRLIDEARD